MDDSFFQTLLIGLVLLNILYCLIAGSLALTLVNIHLLIKTRKIKQAGMAELADANGLSPFVERRVGSNPSSGTNK